MFEETGSLVECSVCETEFDPTAAGGWCTNPDCGEWKYDGDDAPSPAEENDTQEGESGGEDPSESDTQAESTAGEITGEAETDHSTDKTDSGEDPLADDAADPSSVEADEESAEADELEESSSVEDEEGSAKTDEAGESPSLEADEGDDSDRAGADEETARSEDQTEGISCPGCGDTLDADANFCPSCGEDVSAVEPDTEVELTACPACGDDVDAGDSFCASCGENLDAHRESTPLTECPDCGVAVDEDDHFCAECGENLDAHRERDADETAPAESTTDETETAPDSLLLETRGREIAVSDGEIVGRELRKIITETGGDENDAVRIHREHIRFVREDGEFYLVDLGENPTEVNGRSLAKGDREPIAPGDTITLSDVVTLAVARP